MNASVNIQRKQKTLEAFGRLPDEFTIDDVMRCFGLSVDSSKVRIFRLQKDHLVEKIGEFKENGTTKAKYKKAPCILL